MTRHPAMVVATLQGQPGKEVPFEEELRALFAPRHTEDGCLLFALHRLVDDPTRFCVIERWSSRTTLGAHLDSPRIPAYLAAMWGPPGLATADRCV